MARETIYTTPFENDMRIWTFILWSDDYAELFLTFSFSAAVETVRLLEVDFPTYFDPAE